jgi:hypothetical protein
VINAALFRERGASKGGCQSAAFPKTPKPKFKKNREFVDIMIPGV